MASWLKKIFINPEAAGGDYEEGLIEDEDAEYQPEEQTESMDAEEGQLALDAYQTKDDVVVQSTIAGVKPEDLEISLSSNMVTIQGERKRNEEVNQGDYFYQECYWGGFSRSLTLPVEVDVDKAQAEIKDGVLTLVLPKASRSKIKKIKVRGEE
ncbi:MAG: Hsp20/alpha crystallin family protein [Candidatus Doudnabacteria bacterium]|nr:Hsp20/alpha crystallin family protein [bacterium]MDZ4243763.1 Hsp20/alpha crystallin family protein [Candidatus Doudnabacteria bacterium]